LKIIYPAPNGMSHEIIEYIILLTTYMSMCHCITFWTENQKNESWWKTRLSGAAEILLPSLGN